MSSVMCCRKEEKDADLACNTVPMHPICVTMIYKIAEHEYLEGGNVDANCENFGHTRSLSS